MFVMHFPGSAGGDPNDFFSTVFMLASVPHVVIFLLLALWMSVLGGAIIRNLQCAGRRRSASIPPRARKVKQ